eukprot:m.104524 g.104524  ORF g.104524 m.104524 type:complete len:246 (-) comp16852_c0_seq3:30-767(-)
MSSTTPGHTRGAHRFLNNQNIQGSAYGGVSSAMNSGNSAEPAAQVQNASSGQVTLDQTGLLLIARSLLLECAEQQLINQTDPVAAVGFLVSAQQCLRRLADRGTTVPHGDPAHLDPGEPIDCGDPLHACALSSDGSRAASDAVGSTRSARGGDVGSATAGSSHPGLLAGVSYRSSAAATDAAAGKSAGHSRAKAKGKYATYTTKGRMGKKRKKPKRKRVPYGSGVYAQRARQAARAALENSAERH